ncbi:hypothetical protein M3Y99_01847200 [Aphelenchoides fujianensis]|nr:hypothetical protein M3Y99_01847200 [Aphelenchoides fujianensis]
MFSLCTFCFFLRVLFCTTLSSHHRQPWDDRNSAADEAVAEAAASVRAAAAWAAAEASEAAGAASAAVEEVAAEDSVDAAAAATVRSATAAVDAAADSAEAVERPGGKTVIVEPHRFEGIFIVKGKEDALATKNIAPGESVYGEKRVSVNNAEGVPIEYRVWNPFRSKLGAAVMAGTENIHIKPGAKFAHRSGRDLLGVAKKRPNVVPIVDDARMPQRYSMIVGIVDVIFSDVAQPDQARIVAMNAHKFLKNGGHAVISIKANCIDSTAEPEAVFAGEVEKLKKEQFAPREQCTLEPYERDHCVVVAQYRSSKVKKSAA